MAKSTFSTTVLAFAFLLSLAVVAVADNIGTMYDDFCCQTYTLIDGQTSPNGKWVNIWNGFGSSGVEQLADGNYVFFEQPKTAKGTNTYSTLVASTQTFSDFEVSMDVKTVKQLKTRARPWEVAWALFRYTNTSNYYYFTYKTNGIELGKKQGSLGQIFLYTASNPKLTIGQWNHWHIKVVGNHIQVWIDGNLVVDFVDQNMAPQLASGSINMYTEDARVNFDNIYISVLTS